MVLVVLILVALSAAPSVLLLVFKHLTGIDIVLLRIQVVRTHKKRLCKGIDSRLVVLCRERHISEIIVVVSTMAALKRALFNFLHRFHCPLSVTLSVEVRSEVVIGRH